MTEKDYLWGYENDKESKKPFFGMPKTCYHMKTTKLKFGQQIIL